jgi:hypothetical protein
MSNRPLPQWAYVPAEADYDTLWQAKALVPSRLRDLVAGLGRGFGEIKCRFHS